MIDDRREHAERRVTLSGDDVGHLLPDDALAIVEFVGVAERPRDAEAESAERHDKQ